MAGGGIGEPATTKPAAPVPTGAPLDGSPKFEAVTPVDMNSPPATAGATSPTTLPAAGAGTPFIGLPPWLSIWSGARHGAGTAPSTGGSGYKPFVPGTNLTGYAGPRAPAVYAPPKPTTPAAAAPAGIFDAPMFDPNSGMYKMPDGSMQFQDRLSASQRAAADAYSNWLLRQKATTWGQYGIPN